MIPEDYMDQRSSAPTKREGAYFATIKEIPETL
jgi:hypothetical protein